MCYCVCVCVCVCERERERIDSFFHFKQTHSVSKQQMLLQSLISYNTNQKQKTDWIEIGKKEVTESSRKFGNEYIFGIPAGNS